MSHDVRVLCYAIACLVMAASAVVELVDKRRLTWSLLVSVSWAVVMFVWWQTV